MNRYLAFIFVLLLGCSGAPSDLIPRARMEGVLWDMIQADKFSNQYLRKDSSKNILKEDFRMYEKVFQLHHISKDQFIASYRYYFDHPDQLEVIFDSLDARGHRERLELYKPLPHKPVHNDSLPRGPHNRPDKPLKIVPGGPAGLIKLHKPPK